MGFNARDHFGEFSSGSPALAPETYEIQTIAKADPSGLSRKFRVFKFLFDYGSAILALPLVIIISVILFIINPFINPGQVFFTQQRMGKSGKAFKMWKFRTMRVAKATSRDPNADVEADRIPKFCNFMRKTRIDELPNFINVLRGEMSVIGPRPDAFNHAVHFSEHVTGYLARHRVKPGITGLAQVEMGYVIGEEATSLKAKYDNIYVTRFCGRMDLYIIRRTFGVMAKAIGK